VFLDLQRKMSPSEKLQRTLEWSAMIGSSGKPACVNATPNADERELFLRMARQNLGPELFRKVYGEDDYGSPGQRS